MKNQDQDLSLISETIWSLFRSALTTAAEFGMNGTSLEECAANRDELEAEIEKAQEWDLLPFRHARIAVKAAEEAAMLHLDNPYYPTGGYYASYHDAARAFAHDCCNCASGWVEHWDEIEPTRVEPLGEAMSWAAVRGVNITALDEYEGPESEPIEWYALLCSLEDRFRTGIEVEFAATGAARSDLDRENRFKPKPCPKCSGPCRVDRTVGRVRYVSCRSRICEWKGKETG